MNYKQIQTQMIFNLAKKNIILAKKNMAIKLHFNTPASPHNGNAGEKLHRVIKKVLVEL